MSALQHTLREAAKVADLIVIGGGSGRGKHDLLQTSISSVGTLFFSSVEHGPGHRTCFALVDKVLVIGVVGPPGGEEMTFDFYVVPGIRALLFGIITKDLKHLQLIRGTVNVFGT